ncbi:phage regulatory CII family protein [Undibacterium danionis]|uniref:Phage regulatory CII family protein n=1 Tax=Undibacterium danionis TaxID=1812100 RepID=A0ABV6IJ31_9BURK
MTPQDAFYQTVTTFSGGVESLAPRLGMSAQILRNKANPNNVHNYPSLSDIERTMTITGNVIILHALAQSQSHICIPINTDSSACDTAILELVAKVWSTNGDVGQAVNDTLADGRVEAHEVKRVDDAIHRTITALHDMAARLKGLSE